MSEIVERASSCDPRLCSLAERPHAHCSCGLPMAPDAEVCQLCIGEHLDPVEQPRRRGVDVPAAWDGVSYPSRRRRRISTRDPDTYRQLIAVVLGSEEPGYLRLEGPNSRHLSRSRRRAFDPSPSPEARVLAREAADEPNHGVHAQRGGEVRLG